MTADNILQLKTAAALSALHHLQNGMIIGLGSGSTAELALPLLASRISNGLQILAVPTSIRTARLARHLHIPLTTLLHHPHLHLTIDGADQVHLPSLSAIKGLGGNLLREKIVALASHTLILIVDHTKIAHTLGHPTPLPVEIVPFGWTNTSNALAQLGCHPTRRLTKNGKPFITDNHNYLIDCNFPLIQDPPALAATIKSITGVIDHGLFTGIPTRIIVASPSGILDFGF